MNVHVMCYKNMSMQIFGLYNRVKWMNPNGTLKITSMVTALLKYTYISRNSFKCNSLETRHSQRDCNHVVRQK